MVDNQQAVTTFFYNAIDTAAQWFKEFFEKLMRELRKQIYPNEQQQNIPYYNTLNYLPMWWPYNPTYTTDKTT